MWSTLGYIALVLLPLVGYSIGAVAASRRSENRDGDDPAPSMIDTLAVVAIWVGAFISHGYGLGHLAAALIWLGVALATGFILAKVQTGPGGFNPLTS